MGVGEVESSYTKREKRMLRIVRAIKKLYRKCPFDKKDNLRPKNCIKAIPIRLLTPDFPSWEGLGVG
ncbi:MAG: hypothetical protein F6K39_06205 [Okeania sp. SIO3B3]|nr:hypothetical protein [Okeania sp. SIO3B3]